MIIYRPRQSLHKSPSSNRRSPRYKLFLLTWLAIYPLITIILHFFGQISHFIALNPPYFDFERFSSLSDDLLGNANADETIS